MLLLFLVAYDVCAGFLTHAACVCVGVGVAVVGGVGVAVVAGNQFCCYYYICCCCYCFYKYLYCF